MKLQKVFNNMNIWLDFSNSPHVHFFNPIIKEIKKQNHDIHITVRDFAQTKDLSTILGFDYETIGNHADGNVIKKMVNISGRAKKLRHWAKKKGFDLAVGHNSYAQCIAAKTLGIKTVTIMDYEHQPANHVSFRLADKIIVPLVFPDHDLVRYGVAKRKAYKYMGIKEDVYLSGFEPQEDFASTLEENIRKKIPTYKYNEFVLATVRPPATMAAYHRFDNHFFDSVLEYLSGFKNTVMVLLPRTEEQSCQSTLKNNPHHTTLLAHKPPIETTCSTGPSRHTPQDNTRTPQHAQPCHDNMLVYHSQIFMPRERQVY